MGEAGRYLRNLRQCHHYAWWFARAIALFRRPGSFLGHYMRRTSPAARTVVMRDGTRIVLSEHPHDIITLFVVLVREDYGRIDPGITVVDIGANIGAFALYAAKKGAGQVLAYEPNGASFRCLEQNVLGNRLKSVIQAKRLAVTGQAGRTVRFPAEASMYGRIAEAGRAGGLESVETTSLARIVESDAPQGIDLLKIDCEGAEYDILLGAEAALAHVREIRMEYHDGRPRELVELFRRCGFEITRQRADGSTFGDIWAHRGSPRAP